MTLAKFLFLVYLFIVSDIIASGIAGYVLWTWRKLNGESRLVKTLALFMLAICFEGICALVAQGFGYKEPPVYTLAYAWTFWVGRAARSVALWGLVLVILRKRT